MKLEDFLLLICFLGPMGVLMWIMVIAVIVALLDTAFDVSVVEKIKNWRKPNG